VPAGSGPPASRPRGSSPKRVALALGSGGARGYAHIGVIQALHERGYEVTGIAGSSMGAVVGGLQAAGRIDEFAEWAKSLNQRSILRLLDPSITAAGVLRAEKILDAVRDILGPVDIEDLPIPFTAVATDLLSGKSVWFQRGPLDDAIRASIAIPGVIAPHEIQGRLLADGGILDPLPMAPISAINADVTIAVSLNGSGPKDFVDDHDEEPGPTVEWLSRVVRSTSALFDASAARSLLDSPTARAVLSRFGAPTQESEDWDDKTDTELHEDADEEAVEPEVEAHPPVVPKMGSFDVMNRTIDIAQAALARHTLATYPPDVLIEVPRTTARSLEFYRAVEVIDVGRELAMQALDAFEFGKISPESLQPPAIEGPA
jgi:NTE family protein